MIFFAGNDGTIVKSVPSPVYQGGANANDIFLVAPFAKNCDVTVAFKLPNGVIIAREPMTEIGEIPALINEKTGKPYSGWQYSLPNNITEYFGVVTAQFYFYGAQTGKVLASSSTNFVVGQGVPEILTEEPVEGPNATYNIIYSNITALKQQLENGTFAARAIYAYNSQYVYGAGELVFYPDKSEYGTFLKSLVVDNNNAPYLNGELNSQYWQEVIDFDILNGLYDVREDVAQYAQNAADSADQASGSAESAVASSQSAAESAGAAENAQAAAEKANDEAKSWADVAKSFAEFGIKINTEYSSVDDLPIPGNSQFIYLIPNGSTGANSYDEYIWADSKGGYEKIGTTEIDLSGYVLKSGDTMTGDLTAPVLNATDEVQENGIRVYSPNNPPPTVTVDAELSLISTNPVQNKVVTEALENAKITVDSELSSTSTNPVQNKVINNALSSKANTSGSYPYMSVGIATNDGKGNNIANQIANLNDNKVNKSGDTITGNLTVQGQLKGDTVYDGTERVWSNNNRPTAPTYNASTTTNQIGQTDTVVEYYKTSNGSFWYRKWASGWKECGGYYNNSNSSAGNNDITFGNNFAFSNANYVITFGAQRQDSSTSTQVKELGFLSKSATGFTKYFPKSGYEPQTLYYCCGY